MKIGSGRNPQTILTPLSSPVRAPLLDHDIETIQSAALRIDLGEIYKPFGWAQKFSRYFPPILTMQLPTRALLAVVLQVALVAAQDSNYTAGLAAALNGAGLTLLAGILGSAPPALISALQQGNHTVFAPSNAALTGINPADPSLNISNILAYHVTGAPIDTGTLNETDSVVRTALTGAPTVLLPGNQTQVLVVNKASNGTVNVKNAGRTIPVSNNATYQNLQVFVIGRVLEIPGNLSSVVGATTDLSALAGAVTAALPNLIPTLEATRGLTLFAPVNSAINAAAGTIGQANETVLTNVLLNHVINGTAVYSPLITNGGNITSAGGQPLTFTTNSTGVFVTSGSSTAKVVQANVLTSNGVVHLIDNVLLNTNNNPDAAASAASSIAASEASNTGTPTGAVTPTSSGNAAIGAFEFANNVKVFSAVIAGVVLGASLL